MCCRCLHLMSTFCSLPPLDQSSQCVHTAIINITGRSISTQTGSSENHLQRPGIRFRSNTTPCEAPPNRLHTRLLQPPPEYWRIIFTAEVVDTAQQDLKESSLTRTI